MSHKLQLVFPRDKLKFVGQFDIVGVFPGEADLTQCRIESSVRAETPCTNSQSLQQLQTFATEASG